MSYSVDSTLVLSYSVDATHVLSYSVDATPVLSYSVDATPVLSYSVDATPVEKQLISNNFKSLKLSKDYEGLGLIRRTNKSHLSLSESEFKEFEPRLKSAKIWFQLKHWIQF